MPHAGGSCPAGERLVFQHPFGVDAVAACGIVDEYVGYCAHKFAVLDDGAATHALNDAAGNFYQAFVGDVDD